MRARRGATLVELLVALTLLGIVGSAAVAAMRMQTTVRMRVGSRVTAAVRQHEALAPLTADLTVASLTGGDIAFGGGTDSTLDLQATVATGYTCGDTADARALTIAVLSSAAGRAIGVGDTIRVYAGAPPEWRTAAIRSVGRSADITACTGAPDVTALRVTVDSAVRTGITPGSPLHVTRRLRYSFYRASDGDTYLGLREWSAASGRLATVQPIAGPFDGDSVGFTYTDRAGRTLAAPVNAREIALVRVRLGTTRRMRSAGAPASVTGILGLRNRP